jgi:hypothetical protein
MAVRADGRDRFWPANSLLPGKITAVICDDFAMIWPGVSRSRGGKIGIITTW